MTARAYSLIRIRAGDYLLPSNDGATLWRIRRYEDGPSYGLDDWPRDRLFWGAWRYVGRVAWRDGLTADQLDDLLDADAWDGPEGDYLTTRSAAIAAALA